MTISALAPDHVWSLVDLWLDVDVPVACFCDGSDAPLHFLSVELELCVGDVVVELLEGLGVVCALFVGDVILISLKVSLYVLKYCVPAAVLVVKVNVTLNDEHACFFENRIHMRVLLVFTLITLNNSYLCYAFLFPRGRGTDEGVTDEPLLFFVTLFCMMKMTWEGFWGGVREEHRPRPCLRASSFIFNAKAEVRFDERQRGSLHFLWQETIRVRKQWTWHRNEECPQVHQKAPKEFHFLYTTCVCRSFGCNGSQSRRSKHSSA